MQLQDIVKLHRKKASLTQQQLADLASIGKTTVFDIEHGKASVRLDSLLKVLNVLNIKLSLQSSFIKEPTFLR